MPTAQDPEFVKIIEVREVPKVPQDSPPKPPGPKRRWRYLLWAIFALLIALFLWLATNSNPFADGIQELAGNKHDQAIVDVPFSLSPHNFRYYKFSLPEASTNVAILGDFTVLPDSAPRNSARRRPVQAEEGVEVYVLSDSSFAIWQTGYATSPVFESGRVSQGRLAADLPAGAGVYYLIFSNKFCSSAAKKVDATVVLHYKNWIPSWIRHAKTELWSWMFS